MFNEKYAINWAKETVWAVLFGIGAAIGPLLLELDVDMVAVWGLDDWKAYTLVLGIAAGRVAIAILSNSIRSLLGKDD